jgi:murein DD-endopeptidase MepM/ murein hydrolase activator NlpD
MPTLLELRHRRAARRRRSASSFRLGVLLLLLGSAVSAGPAGAQPAPPPFASPVRAVGATGGGWDARPTAIVLAPSRSARAWPPSSPLLRVRPRRPAPSEGVWPLRPRPAVVAGFHPPASRWGAGHRGVDLAGAPGAAVHSSLPGTVTFAGRIAGRGVVVVSHGATRTTYEPVTASVAVGDRVGAGTALGHLALFGSHCFPHWCLHWGLIEGRDHYLDPLTLVGAAPVRLLPLGEP